MLAKELQQQSRVNFSRYPHVLARNGFYESFFIRANAPCGQKAFWIRYTQTQSKGKQERIGELWAVFFDGDRTYVDKKTVSDSSIHFSKRHFNIELGEAFLKNGQAEGICNSISWSLSFKGDQKSIFLLPSSLYSMPFPKSKSITSDPMVSFNGKIMVGRVEYDIADWIGSQNHNWGEKHTDQYAWGQVCGFDNSPDTFLELISAKLDVGPIQTPMLTSVVFRHKGILHSFNALNKWIKNKGSYNYSTWSFSCENDEMVLSGTISTPIEHFVGLAYTNPPRGKKYCLNTKQAKCTLHVEEFNGIGMPQSLVSRSRCAFEILTDEDESYHGVNIER